MSKHFVLKVYDVEVHESAGREEDVVTVQFEGDLRPKTKAAIAKALVKNSSLRIKKKVLA